MQAIKWATLLFGAIFVVIVASTINAPHLYYMAAILLTLPGVSYALGWLALRDLTFERETPPQLWAGEESEILYVVHNPTRLPRYFISCRETFPDWIEPLTETPPMFNASANETAKVIYPLRFLRRGVHQLHGFDAIATDPLGVFAFGKRIESPSEIVVYPTPETMRREEWTGEDRYGWQEFTSMALRGNSVDPDGVRLYVPGDPLRRIHWRQTARTGNLTVIEFEEPQAVQIHILLDTHSRYNIGEGIHTTFETMIRFAATVAQQATAKNANANLILPNSLESETTLASRGQMQLIKTLDKLARIEANGGESIGEVTTNLIGKISAGATLLVLTANADKTLPDALTSHRAHGNQTAVVYFDPTNFDKSAPRESTASLQDFGNLLHASQTAFFLVKHRPDGKIIPEVANYGNL